ncbi:hypothetical protein ACFY05_02170 [Microtetraspora fusca]|uniref:Uncharacterized protein n=1 Tax=Microtetraspora fusca TaxID=1997 RepID=A0ABW6UX67_MICFU
MVTIASFCRSDAAVGFVVERGELGFEVEDLGQAPGAPVGPIVVERTHAREPRLKGQASRSTCTD